MPCQLMAVCCHGNFTIRGVGAQEAQVTCPKQELVALTISNLLDSWVYSELSIFF